MLEDATVGPWHVRNAGSVAQFDFHQSDEVESVLPLAVCVCVCVCVCMKRNV